MTRFLRLFIGFRKVDSRILSELFIGLKALEDEGLLLGNSFYGF
jgi:hypothetical protein